MEHKDKIKEHYEVVWGSQGQCRFWYKGPIETLNPDFCVLQFPPSKKRDDMWTYATCCMSLPTDHNPVELHLFSPIKDDGIIELLTAVASYHQEVKLNLHHTINFGRPWQDESNCEYGLISLPYLDGPALENGNFNTTKNTVKFYWLIPVTKEEVEFKKKYGVEELEQKFESIGLNYLSPKRNSIV